MSFDHLQQRCQISYYPEPHQEIVIDLDWDDVDQVVVMVQGSRFTVVRNEHIEGDLTVRDVITQFGYGNCVAYLHMYYQSLGMTVESVMNTTVHELEPVQLQIYRDMDVFDAMNHIEDVRDDRDIQDIQDNQDIQNNDVDEKINDIHNINISQIIQELHELNVPDLYIIDNITEYITNNHDFDYETIAHEVALFVLNE